MARGDLAEIAVESCAVRQRMTDQLPEKPPDSQVLFYQTEDGRRRKELGTN